MENHNYIINSSKIYTAMAEKGFKTIEELSLALGVHRNTISPYLNGTRALPDCLNRLLNILEIKASEAIIPSTQIKKQHGLDIAPLIEKMITLRPDICFILFGSRAKGNARKYSDYDIGVYSKTSLTFYEFSKLIDLTEDYKSNLHFDVNLTNFSLADDEFLKDVKSHWIFLGGNFASWIALQNKAGIVLYE